MKAQLTGMRGVYLVAAELSRIGFIASPTSRSARGADILVTDQLCQHAFSVQVKTNADAPNFWLVGQHAQQTPPSKTHVYVLVNLFSHRPGGQPEYYVVPSSDITSRVVVSARPKSTFYSIFRDDNDQKGIKGISEFKEKWDVFGDPHAEAKVEETPEMIELLEASSN